MDVLLAFQSSLHWLAVFCSAIADCDKARSPTNTAHTAKVGFITHISGLRENSAHAHGLAATASARRKLPRWQPQCGPQPLTGSVLLFAFCSYDVKNKERTTLGKRKRRRRRAPPSIAGRLLPPSMRGERRGVRLHRRLGGDRGFGRFGLLLVPFDRLGLARERAREHLVHARDRNDVEAFLDAVADLDQILGVLLRDQ